MSLRLFVDLPLQAAGEFPLPDAAARHVQVRRLQPGDALCLFNGAGGEWAATVLHMGRREVTVRMGSHHAVERELACRVTLALGMPANERMDILVEKATELGAHAIQPLLCERSVLRLAGDRALRKREHWQGIAAAAAEQCGRTRVPQVAAVRSLPQWLASLGPRSAAETRLLLSPLPDAAALAAMPEVPPSMTMISGPEGGLAASEQALALLQGFVPARLGPTVLRAETAPLAALAWVGLRSVATGHSADSSDPPQT